MSAAEFKKQGCPNCDDILKMKAEQERVLECTTGTYDGAIALINPEDSWVAKWQRINKFVPGLYAVRLTGSLPDDIQDELRERRIPIRGSAAEDH
ncbi:transcription initiation Spt4 [Atractiella rhizophila]|nr:transcription initiation Spt4 [Atractiella rhizophila]